MATIDTIYLIGLYITLRNILKARVERIMCNLIKRNVISRWFIAMLLSPWILVVFYHRITILNALTDILNRLIL